MDSNKKKSIMEKIEKYGELRVEGRKYSAKKLLEEIDGEIVTDRDQFMKWLEES